MEETRKRLDTIEVTAEAGGGAVRVVATGNREIKNVTINKELIEDGDVEQIEDLVTVAVNRALEQADDINEAEMKAVSAEFLPNMPGMFGQ